MRILVFGSRGWRGPGGVHGRGVVAMYLAMSHADDVARGATLVHGACPNSPDAWAAEWWADMSERLGYVEPKIIDCPADWKAHGRAAGPRRNAEMAEMIDPHGDLAIGFWDGQSRGTWNMIKTLNRRGVCTKIYMCPQRAPNGPRDSEIENLPEK